MYQMDQVGPPSLPPSLLLSLLLTFCSTNLPLPPSLPPSLPSSPQAKYDKTCPSMFQSAEYVSEHGQIDYVVDPAKEVRREGGRERGSE